MDVLLVTNPRTQQVTQRLLVCGHSNGLLTLHITDIQADDSAKTISKTLEYDSFISTVRFFYHNHRPTEGKRG